MPSSQGIRVRILATLTTANKLMPVSLFRKKVTPAHLAYEPWTPANISAQLFAQILTGEHILVRISALCCGITGGDFAQRLDRECPVAADDIRFAFMAASVHADIRHSKRYRILPNIFAPLLHSGTPLDYKQVLLTLYYSMAQCCLGKDAMGEIRTYSEPIRATQML